MAFLPARPLEQISCHDVLQALRVNQSGTVATREDAVRELMRGHVQRFDAAERAVAAEVTLATLAGAARRA